MRRGPEAVLVERVALHRQRVVHADRLARDLLPVAIDRQVRREVGGIAGGHARSIEAQVLDEQQAGRADGLDRERLALRDHQALLVAQPGADRGREQEGDQAEVREQRRELRVLVPVAVDEARPVVGHGLAKPEATLAKDAPDGVRRHVAHLCAVRQLRVEERVRLIHAHVRHAAPQAGDPVDRAAHDREHEDDQRGAEPRRAEHLEDPEALEGADAGGPEQRVVQRVDQVHLVRVVGR